MSDAQENTGHPHAPDPHDDHDSPIRTPKQLVSVIVASFVVPILVIIMLVNFVDFGQKEGAGSTGMTPEAVAQRLQRVGTVEIRDVNSPTAMRTGEQVYQAQCAACHAIGAAGSPKFGDAAAWGPRVTTGLSSLLNSAMNGKGAMPKQSGGDASDYEIARAVVYMANQGGGKFDEPAAPAAAASSPAPAAAATSAPK